MEDFEIGWYCAAMCLVEEEEEYETAEEEYDASEEEYEAASEEEQNSVGR